MRPALARRAGTFIPTPSQHLLLRAALLTDHAAVLDALTRWTAATRLERVDPGSARLVPQLYRSLERLGIAHPWTDRFRGMYRHSWSRNEILLEGGREAIRALRAAGIPVVLLKGAALAASVVPDHAVRPMQDFDVLVPRPAFGDAANALGREDWRITPPVRDAEAHFTFRHAVNLRRGAAQVDLHWAAVWGMFDAEGEREFWREARPVTFRGEGALVLAPSDQLLQVVAHATLAHPTVPPIRWAADATLLLAAEPAFDWDRFVRMAAMRRQSLSAARCVEYLRDGLEVGLPPRVPQDLRRQARSLERPQLALRSSLGIGYRVHALTLWLATARLDGVRHLPWRLRLMLRFVRSRIGAPR